MNAANMIAIRYKTMLKKVKAFSQMMRTLLFSRLAVETLANPSCFRCLICSGVKPSFGSTSKRVGFLIAWLCFFMATILGLLQYFAKGNRRNDHKFKILFDMD